MEKSCQAEFQWTERNEARRRNYLTESQLTRCEIDLLLILWGLAKIVKHDGNWLVSRVAKRQMGGGGFSPEAMRKAALRLSESASAILRIEPGKGGKPSVYWLDCQVLSRLSELTRSELRAKRSVEPDPLGNRLPRVTETSLKRRVSRASSRVQTRDSDSNGCQAPKQSRSVADQRDDPLAEILHSEMPWGDLRDWHVRSLDLRLARFLYGQAVATHVLADVDSAKLFLAQFHHCAVLRKQCSGQRDDGTGGRNNAAAILQSLVRSGRRDVLQDASWDWAAAQIRRRSDASRGKPSILKSAQVTT